jgi:hypothetical protein
MSLTEGGPSGSYTLRLASQPTADVIITLTSSLHAVTLNVTTLTFTAANWNIPQTVVVTAIDNTIVDGTRAETIHPSVSSADLFYHEKHVFDTAVAVTDNDSAPTSSFKSFLPLIVR